MSTSEPVEQFITRWAAAGGTERANYQLFLSELTVLLDLPRPEPASDDTSDNAYVFERRVDFRHGDGSESRGFIDLYRRGAFVCEAKQTGQTLGSGRWDNAMLRARGQAEAYARALPAGEGRPPFLIVTDVGRSIELYAEFSRSGATYVPFPDVRSHRIALPDLRRDEIRERLRAVWLDPLALDPTRRSARVTREVADRLARLARSLEQAGQPSETVAAFLMRSLFTMFAEDVGLLPAESFKALLQECERTPEAFVPLVGGLWQDMNRGSMFSATIRARVLRFNGGLFADATVLPLDRDQIRLLREAARADWRHVEPAIFGTLLERALDPRERHALGAHYTPRAYVERLVLPTVIEPLRANWQNAQAAAALLDAQGRHREAVETVRAFHGSLCRVRVLDPACGSGNFLYVTLEHMKRLEGEVLATLEELGETQGLLQMEGISVDPHQFLGLEVNPRAARIAEAVLWIGYLQWHFRTFGNVTPPEPVLRDFRNIECRDAVLAWDRVEYLTDERGVPVTRWDGITFKPHPATGEQVPDDAARMPVERYVNARKAEWPQADYIVGNPPFIGAASVRRALGDGYAEALRGAWREVPESADFVMHWWHIAAEQTRAGRARRFGLITTNSLPQVFNRRVVQAQLEPRPSPGETGGATLRRAPTPHAQELRRDAAFAETLRNRARQLRAGQTDAEQLLWQVLRGRNALGFKFRRQHPLQGYILDFYCPELRLAIELDGGQHADQAAYDRQRSEALATVGVRVIRFWNNEVLQETDAVMDAIASALMGGPAPAGAESFPSPRPLPAGGEREMLPLSIVFAVPDHPWVDSADGAAVRISMTVGEAGERDGLLAKVMAEHEAGEEGVEVQLAERTGRIHADLKIGANVSAAVPLRANLGISSPGVKLHGAGFVVTPAEARRLLAGTPQQETLSPPAGRGEGEGRPVIRQYRNGRDLTDAPRGVMVIDLFGMPEEEVRTRYPAVYQWLLDRVKPERDQNSRATYRDNWWIFGEPRRELRHYLEGLPRYIATVETTKHRVFQFLDAGILPDNMLVNIALADAYWLGILSSRVHAMWALAAGGRLGVGNDPRYNKSRCFEPFPFPDASHAKAAEIRALAEDLDAHRKRVLSTSTALPEGGRELPSPNPLPAGGERAREAASPRPAARGEGAGVRGGSRVLTLTGMYNVLEKLRSGEALSAKDRAIHEQGLVSVLRELHDRLDAAVLNAYGWGDLAPALVGRPGATLPLADKAPAQAAAEEELLTRLVALNAERAAEEARGHIRWLRPEFQAPQAVRQPTAQGELETDQVQAIAPVTPESDRTPWPRTLPEQVQALRQTLAAGDVPQPVEAIAARFKGAPRARVSEVLDTLVALGQARGDGASGYSA